MAFEVTLPRLADTLVEGTVSRWLKRPGDRVLRGEPLLEVETDKVNSEVESPLDGVLTEILVLEGSTVPVGQVIARIEPAGSGGAGATGKGEAATRAEAAPEPAPRGGLPPLRRRIAERMQQARATVEQGACVLEVDLSGIRRFGSWTAYFVKALASAGGYADVGVAVEVPGGLVVPVVRDCLRKTVAEISEAIEDLATRARAGQLRPAEVRGGEFTVTNVGTFGTLLALPLVNPGQPGILAPGAVVSGRCHLTLCYDRAAMDQSAADDLLTKVATELARLSA